MSAEVPAHFSPGTGSAGLFGESASGTEEMPTLALSSTPKGFSLGSPALPVPGQVAAALAHAVSALTQAGIDTPRLDAQLLLAWTLKVRREDLAREPERVLAERERIIYEKALALRTERRPLPYITGEAWFYGRPFKINRAVLIPRPETEMLVESALQIWQNEAAPRLADIGTGSGCLAVTLACEMPAAQVFATDLSADALTLARKNVVRYGLTEQVTLLQGNLLSPLPPEQRL